jgi:nitroreductase
MVKVAHHFSLLFVPPATAAEWRFTMIVYETILKRRTIRKFKQDAIENDILEKLINAARYAPSGANLQPIKYKIVNESDEAEKIFQNLKWAAYIAPEGTPKEGEKPVAYIVILIDTEIRTSGYELDVGAAAQSIFLAALEEEIGTCWVCSVNKNEVRSILKIPERFIINSVIALGYPAESPVTEEEDGSIKYYKDAEGILRVPKRKLKDIII